MVTQIASLGMDGEDSMQLFPIQCTAGFSRVTVWRGQMDLAVECRSVWHFVVRPFFVSQHLAGTGSIP